MNKPLPFGDMLTVFAQARAKHGPEYWKHFVRRDYDGKIECVKAEHYIYSDVNRTYLYDPLPETETVTLELPKPLTELPEDGDIYTPNFGWEDGFNTWFVDSPEAVHALKGRTAFATVEDAVAFTKAIRERGND